MAGGCAVRDCGDPDCRVCQWARRRAAALHAGNTEVQQTRDVRELPPATGTRRPSATPVYDENQRLIAAPKKRHRVGPHR